MTLSSDLLVLNARPWSGAVLADADAIAIARGKIQAIGRGRDLEGWRKPSTRVIDAGGATVTPGLVDAHIHLLAWARGRLELDLGGCASRAEALIRVSRHLAAHPGTAPLVGRGWQSDHWEAPPDAASLDAVSGERPVLLHSKDFHALWVNRAALATAGIGERSADPAGGVIERDTAGRPTGILREHAVRACADLERAAAASPGEVLGPAIRALHAAGVTAVHDFEGEEAFHALRAVATVERSLRVLMHVPHANLDHALTLGLESGVGDDRFRVGAIKLFADGTLGSMTAALLDPYDGTDRTGLDLLSADELGDAIRRAFAGGLSVAIHAIGDRAVRRSLDAIDRERHRVASLALAPRLEHVQLIAESDVPRLAALGVAASMQPSHCTSDIELAERWWGSRVARTYPWRALWDRGVTLAFGSDAPVEPPDTAVGLHAAVTRARPAGGAYVPEQCLDLDQALLAYTRGPAELAGSWPRLGRLAAGAHADLVVWNTDLHRLPAAELVRVKPRATVLAGEIVFESATHETQHTERAGTERGVTA